MKFEFAIRTEGDHASTRFVITAKLVGALETDDPTKVGNVLKGALADHLWVQSCERDPRPEVIEGSGVREFRDTIEYLKRKVESWSCWGYHVAALKRGEAIDIVDWLKVHDKSPAHASEDNKSRYLGS